MISTAAQDGGKGKPLFFPLGLVSEQLAYKPDQRATKKQREVLPARGTTGGRPTMEHAARRLIRRVLRKGGEGRRRSQGRARTSSSEARSVQA